MVNQAYNFAEYDTFISFDSIINKMTTKLKFLGFIPKEADKQSKLSLEMPNMLSIDAIKLHIVYC